MLPQRSHHEKQIYQAGSTAGIVVLALMPVQILVYVISSPPVTVEEWFDLFNKNWFLGLLNFDLLYVLTNVLMIPIFLSVCYALRRVNEPMVLLGATIIMISIAAYFPSNTSFEMLALSEQHGMQGNMEQNDLIGAGNALLAIYTGTAFNVYYILNAIGLLIISWVMLRSDVFTKGTAYAGITAGLFNMIPSSAGQVGLIASFLALIPTVLWIVLVTIRLSQLGSNKTN